MLHVSIRICASSLCKDKIVIPRELRALVSIETNIHPHPHFFYIQWTGYTSLCNKCIFISEIQNIYSNLTALRLLMWDIYCIWPTLHSWCMFMNKSTTCNCTKHVLVIHCGASYGTQNLLWAVLCQNCGLVLLPEVFSVNISPFTGCLCSTPFHKVAGGQEWAHTLWTMVMGGKCQFICPCSSSYPSLRCCPSSSSFPFFFRVAFFCGCGSPPLTPRWNSQTVYVQLENPPCHKYFLFVSLPVGGVRSHWSRNSFQCLYRSKRKATVVGPVSHFSQCIFQIRLWQSLCSWSQ